MEDDKAMQEGTSVCYIEFLAPFHIQNTVISASMIYPAVGSMLVGALNRLLFGGSCASSLSVELQSDRKQKGQTHKQKHTRARSKWLGKALSSAVSDHQTISTLIPSITHLSEADTEFIAFYNEDSLNWLDACDALKDSLAHLQSYHTLLCLALRSLERRSRAQTKKDSLCYLTHKKNLAKSMSFLRQCMESITEKAERNPKLDGCGNALKEMRNSCRASNFGANHGNTFVGTLRSAHFSTTFVCLAAVKALSIFKKLPRRYDRGTDCMLLSAELLLELQCAHSGASDLYHLLHVVDTNGVNSVDECEKEVTERVGRLHTTTESLGRGLSEVAEQNEILHRRIVCNRLSLLGLLAHHSTGFSI